MGNPTMRVKVYGARGSYSPTKSQATNFGVNTTCLRVDINDLLIILDAGSGIINLGKDLFQEFKQKNGDPDKWKMHLIFTHLHIDHLLGFPYFSMLYMPKSEIHYIGPQILDYSLKDVVQGFMHPPLFPVSMSDLPSKGYYYQITESNVLYFYEDDFKISALTDSVKEGWLAKISCMRNYLHPKGGAFFYKIESNFGPKIVFASDTEGFIGGDQRLIKFSEGCDVLFHDAQYTPSEYAMFQGYGHSTYEMACEVAKKANVKKLLLFHHDPNHDDEVLTDIQQKAQKLFPEAYVASESMEFEFSE